MIDELLEELAELRRENARLRAQLRNTYDRIRRASSELRKGRDPVKLAKELGFPSACVMVEEVLRWRGERD